MINLSTKSNPDAAERQWAVISFVPDDLVWFDWVIRQLEGYPVPSGLSGAATRHGFPLPEKLTLFPDRWNPLNFESYPQALETSRFLVAIISPNSANAPWVTDQIRDFKKAGGDERVIALVIEGKPDLTAPVGDPSWLPKWLAWRLNENGFQPADSTEPIVIDARGGGPKQELARESLIASLLTTTCQELERMGGLTPPLDLTRFAAPRSEEPVTTAPEPPRTETGKSQRPFAKYRFIAAGVAAAALCFAAGWATARVLAPTPSPAPTRHAEKPVRPAKSTATPAEPATQTVAATPPSTPAPANPPPSAPTNPGSPPAVTATAPPSAPPSAPATPTAPSAVTPPIATREAAKPQVPPPAAPAADRNKRDANPMQAEWLSQVAAGDQAVQKGRTVQAVDFYRAALDSAERYLLQHSNDISAIGEMAMLCRRVGGMQVQVASVAEARATYERGHRLLLSIQSRTGQLTAAQAQTLAEIELGLRTLPRE